MTDNNSAPFVFFNSSVSLNSSSFFLANHQELTIWYATSMLLCGIGSVTSLFLLGVVWKQWKRSLRRTGGDQSGTKLLILHATMVEAAMCAVNHPINFTQLFFGKLPVTPTVCTILQLPFALFRTASYWSFAFLALNRFAAICFPVCYRTHIVQPKVSIAVMLITWGISWGVYIPVIFGWGSCFRTLPPFNGCGIKSSAPMANMINQLITTYVPLALTGAVYATLVIFVWCQRILHSSTENTRRSIFRRRPFRLALALFITALWHCVCFFPLTAVTVFDRNGLFAHYPMLNLWLRLVFMLGYVGNPVIFFAMYREYRVQLAIWMKSIQNGKNQVDVEQRNSASYTGKRNSQRMKSTQDPE